MKEKLESPISEKDQMFLGEFPIISSTGHETQRIFYVANKDGSYTTDVSFAYFAEQLDISSAISHNGIDKHLVPRLTLMRDIYTKLISKLKSEKPCGELFGESLLDLAYTQKVLPPKFYLSLDQQGSLKENKADILPREFSEIYGNLVERVCTEFDVQNDKTISDWLHEERIILPVAPGYTFELTKPLGHFQTFEIHADESVDYSRLSDLSERFIELAKSSLGERINIYEDKFTNCNFRVSLDFFVPRKLSAMNLERFLIENGK
jgi:hypothetical protein